MRHLTRLCAILVLLAALTTTGCASFRALTGGSPTATASILTYLEDARSSVVAAHDTSGWLSDADLALATNVLDVATAAVNKDPNGAIIAVKGLVKDFLDRQPADSKLRPYFDWLLVIL